MYIHVNSEKSRLGAAASLGGADGPWGGADAPPPKQAQTASLFETDALPITTLKIGNFLSKFLV